MMQQHGAWVGTTGLVLVSMTVLACFNPPSDGIDTGFETVAPTTVASTTDPDSGEGPLPTTGSTSGPSDGTTVALDDSSSGPGPGTTDAPAQCGDGVVGGDEACDDAGESAACNADCTTAACGDGLLNVTAGETCDDGRASAACDADCTAVECGDGVANEAAGEACDDAGESAACDVDCTLAECGDMVINGAAGEECDDGNGLPGDGCQACLVSVACSGGAVMLGVNPAGSMAVCDDPANVVCEQDAETLCPASWGLCTREQHHARNDAFDYPINGGAVVVGEIYCRGGGGAGHYTLGPYDGVVNLNQDPPLNCGYGSSRAACVSMYGCNETNVSALCCAPSGSCGNGIIDAPEELCDDGNANETDDCLNSCAWRLPSAHGFPSCS